MIIAETYTNESGSNMDQNYFNDGVSLDEVARSLMRYRDWDYAYITAECMGDEILMGTVYRDGSSYTVEPFSVADYM